MKQTGEKLGVKWRRRKAKSKAKLEEGENGEEISEGEMKEESYQ
jgi:hypothetical protein